MADDTPKKVPTFTVEQLANSKRYAKRRDLIRALLDPTKKYSLAEVDKRIKKYLKGTVT